MIKAGADGFQLAAIYIAATASRTDPLAQRAYLAIKMSGGLLADNGSGSLNELRDHITEQVQAILIEALKSPRRDGSRGYGSVIR